MYERESSKFQDPSSKKIRIFKSEIRKGAPKEIYVIIYVSSVLCGSTPRLRAKKSEALNPKIENPSPHEASVFDFLLGAYLELGTSDLFYDFKPNGLMNGLCTRVNLEFVENR